MDSLQMLYLSKEDVMKVNVSMEEIIQSLERMFRLKGEGKTEMPPKPGIHTQKDAFIHAMPAYIPDMNVAGVKWVSGYPDNYKSGLPYITGLMILNSPATGIPLAVMDCTWVTAKRTGAATAVAAKYMARPESHTLGILGCGVQGESNLEALMIVQKQIRTVYTYDIFPQKTESFITKMALQYPQVEFIKAAIPKDAVVDCDIIVTTGPILKEPEPVIEAEWFKEGSFASPVDFDSYWKPAAMHLSAKFCTDDYEQMMYYKQDGYFRNIPEVYADLGQIIAGQKPGRENNQERIMSVNLGLALEDMAVGTIIYERAVQMKLGTWLPL
ncbi:ornithine cyclodeaminase family protein [Paenibacillus eucommiae]|uniref:Ornithine cyclodeaminase/alanine dehydrogenase n=1 Tax=Paenibacillus eucommiae TaxID=1355755 RepID=A0ABS4IS46_9BACL|nr:ornithine cyclodeaminase family protein [Paenibacillus eucommiae]MBP1990409.1 ornithine cyclodeaminase/alanine dehydrogenase [Paenibacillus eucommiae]